MMMKKEIKRQYKTIGKQNKRETTETNMEDNQRKYTDFKINKETKKLNQADGKY